MVRSMDLWPFKHKHDLKLFDLVQILIIRKHFCMENKNKDKKIDANKQSP